MVSRPPGAVDRPLLEVLDLAFGYSGATLLDKVQISVRRGEMLGLLGPNGSGKTTLLRLLSGVLQAQQGKILLEGRDLTSWGRRGVAQRVAVVPQDLHVPFAFTVEQMVALGRTPFLSLLRGKTRHDHALIREAMQLASVETLTGRIFNQLSGGERQRVMVAMALAQQPRLLLLDEPTSHLDIKYQIEILELIQQLNRTTGVTVIAAMHDLNLAARYFPRLLLFQRGIVADGHPVQVLEPAQLQRVYGVNIQVGIMRGTQHLSVLPPNEATPALKAAQSLPHVHVMAGNGSGALTMRALADAQIAFSAGVLAIGDSDHTLALRLASEVLAELPFAPIAPTTRARLHERLASTALLVVCPLPIAPGNLPQLQEALSACQRGLKVLLLLPPQTEPPCLDTATPAQQLQLLASAERDLANGAGTELLRQLLAAGASIEEFLPLDQLLMLR